MARQRNIRKNQSVGSNACILVCIHHVAIPWLLPRITGIGISILAQLPGTVDGFTEFPNDLLDGLRREAGVPPFGPALPAFFGGPAPLQAPDALVPFHQ